MPMTDEIELIQQLGAASTEADLESWHNYARASAAEGRASAMLQEARRVLREGTPADLIELANHDVPQRSAQAAEALRTAVAHR